MRVVEMGELANLERDRCVVEQRRSFGFGEPFEEAFGQGHDPVGPDLDRFFEHDFLQLECVDFSVVVVLLEAQLAELVAGLELDLVERMDLFDVDFG